MKRILIVLTLILVCMTTACGNKQESADSPTAETAAPTVQSTEAAQKPAETAAPTEAPQAAPAEETTPFDRGASEEWVLDGYWCMLSDDGGSVQVYTFGKEDAGHDMYYGYCTLYNIVGDAIVKDSAPDNPSMINYRFEDGNISAVGEGGLQMTFYLSDDGTHLNQAGTEFVNTYYRLTTLPESYDELARVLSGAM